MTTLQTKLNLQSLLDTEADPAKRAVLLTEIEAARQRELAELVAEFVANAEADPDFKLVTTREQRSCCGLWLKGEARKAHCPDDGNLDCLVVAQDVLGNWSCITLDGRTLQFFADEVV